VNDLAKSFIRLPRAHAAVRTDAYLFSHLIPYIGNKRKLLPLIADAIGRTGVTAGLFVDFFAGSSVVARLAKQLDYQVIANDWEPYAFEIANCSIACNTKPLFRRLGGADSVFSHLNALPAISGYVASHLCPVDDDAPNTAVDRMFFTRSNGGKIDAIREQIARWEDADQLDAIERSYLLAPLLFAVSYVSNTSGVFKGFHRGWGGKTRTAHYRILSNLTLRKPILHYSEQTHAAWRLDAQEAANRLRADRITADIAYIDPPYNQHPYGSNYHVLNTVALWDKPQIGCSIGLGDKSAIRTDWRTERRSSYNYRAAAADAYEKLVGSLDARFVLTSYSTDGNIPLDEMLARSAKHGRLACVMNAYKRYRVSTPRMSTKPINVEYVLIIDKSDMSTLSNVAEIRDTILRAEQSALDNHPETAPRPNLALAQKPI
jgi:adenine-specific DNA-methyltransferase